MVEPRQASQVPRVVSSTLRSSGASARTGPSTTRRNRPASSGSAATSAAGSRSSSSAVCGPSGPGAARRASTASRRAPASSPGVSTTGLTPAGTPRGASRSVTEPSGSPPSCTRPVSPSARIRHSTARGPAGRLRPAGAVPGVQDHHGEPAALRQPEPPRRLRGPVRGSPALEEGVEQGTPQLALALALHGHGPAVGPGRGVRQPVDHVPQCGHPGQQPGQRRPVVGGDGLGQQLPQQPAAHPVDAQQGVERQPLPGAERAVGEGLVELGRQAAGAAEQAVDRLAQDPVDPLAQGGPAEQGGVGGAGRVLDG